MLDGINPQQLGIEFGSGALVGAVMGFAAKKVAKLVAVVVGLQLAVFKFLESRGVLTVDWNRVTGGLVDAGNVAASGSPPSWAMSLLSTLSVGSGFTGGFLVGFKQG